MFIVGMLIPNPISKYTLPLGNVAVLMEKTKCIYHGNGIQNQLHQGPRFNQGWCGLSGIYVDFGICRVSVHLILDLRILPAGSTGRVEAGS